MNRYVFALVAGLVALSLVLTGCGPAATEAPAEEPKEEQAEEPVEAAPVTISVWHGYIETEEQVFSQAVSDFMAANPNITVETLAVPFDELQNKFQTEAAAGGGPTLIPGPQDRMAGYASAGLLAEIDESAGFIDDLVPAAVNGGRVDGQLVGLPLNNKVVAMFYNTSMVDTQPADFDELLDMAADSGLAITADWFHNYMWVPAFDAQLFDDDYRCVLVETGAADAFAYFKSVCESEGVTCDPNDGDMDTLFRQGEVAFRFQGPWMAGDAIADLGAENVGVMRIPTIPEAGDPHPWNQSEMISINVNATPEEVEAAMRLIDYLTSAEIQRTFLNEANWIPSNASVDTSTNPVVGGFLDQVPFSDPFPVAAELGATWEPMGNAVTQILEEVLTSEEALTEACDLINTANNK
jgi:arabinogalactan oligomer/maltooligosaccharide transport system substrate-binding protein